jgi:hypothetical protein
LFLWITCLVVPADLALLGHKKSCGGCSPSWLASMDDVIPVMKGANEQWFRKFM